MSSRSQAPPRGSIIVIARDPVDGPATGFAIFRVAPSTGDRTFVYVDPNDGDEAINISGFSTAAVVPGFGAFSPSVAALPIWGIPLAIGIALGLSLRLRRTA